MTHATHVFDNEPSPLDPMHRLARAVIVDALRRFRGRDAVEALDAALWLTDGLTFWADLMGLSNADGYRLLTEGDRGLLHRL